MKYFTIPELKYLIGTNAETAQIKALPYTIGENSRVTLTKHWFGTFTVNSPGDPANNVPATYPNILTDENFQPINVTPLLKYASWREGIAPSLLLEELDIKLLVNVGDDLNPRWLQLDQGDDSNFYWKLTSVANTIAGTPTDQYFLETDVLDAINTQPVGITYVSTSGKNPVALKKWRLSVSNRVKVERQFNFDTLLTSLISHSVLRMNMNGPQLPFDPVGKRRAPSLQPVTGKAVYDFAMNNLSIPSIHLYSNVRIGTDPAMPSAVTTNIKSLTGFLQTDEFKFYSMFNKQVGSTDGRVGYYEDEPEMVWVHRPLTNDQDYVDPTGNPNPMELPSSQVNSSNDVGGQVKPGLMQPSGGRLSINNRYLQYPIPTAARNRNYTLAVTTEAKAIEAIDQNEQNIGTFNITSLESTATKERRERIKNNFSNNDLVPKVIVDYMIRDIVGDLPVIRSLKRTIYTTAGLSQRVDVINRRIIDTGLTDPLTTKSYVDENIKDVSEDIKDVRDSTFHPIGYVYSHFEEPNNPGTPLPSEEIHNEIASVTIVNGGSNNYIGEIYKYEPTGILCALYLKVIGVDETKNRIVTTFEIIHKGWAPQNNLFNKSTVAVTLLKVWKFNPQTGVFAATLESTNTSILFEVEEKKYGFDPGGLHNAPDYLLPYWDPTFVNYLPLKSAAVPLKKWGQEVPNGPFKWLDNGFYNPKVYDVFLDLKQGGLGWYWSGLEWIRIDAHKIDMSAYRKASAQDELENVRWRKFFQEIMGGTIESNTDNNWIEPTFETGWDFIKKAGFKGNNNYGNAVETINKPTGGAPEILQARENIQNAFKSILQELRAHHDHDGTNGLKINYDNLYGKPTKLPALNPLKIERSVGIFEDYDGSKGSLKLPLSGGVYTPSSSEPVKLQLMRQGITGLISGPISSGATRLFLKYNPNLPGGDWDTPSNQAENGVLIVSKNNTEYYGLPKANDDGGYKFWVSGSNLYCITTLTSVKFYTLTADGNANSETTKLIFEFQELLTTAEETAIRLSGNIFIAAATSSAASVTKGAITRNTNNPKQWFLNVTVQTEGFITVALINNPTITSSIKSVEVFKLKIVLNGAQVGGVLCGNATTAITINSSFMLSNGFNINKHLGQEIPPNEFWSSILPPVVSGVAFDGNGIYDAGTNTVTYPINITDNSFEEKVISFAFRNHSIMKNCACTLTIIGHSANFSLTTTTTTIAGKLKTETLIVTFTHPVSGGTWPITSLTLSECLVGLASDVGRYNITSLSISGNIVTLNLVTSKSGIASIAFNKPQIKANIATFQVYCPEIRAISITAAPVVGGRGANAYVILTFTFDIAPSNFLAGLTSASVWEVYSNFAVVGDTNNNNAIAPESTPPDTQGTIRTIFRKVSGNILTWSVKINNLKIKKSTGLNLIISLLDQFFEEIDYAVNVPAPDITGTLSLSKVNDVEVEDTIIATPSSTLDTSEGYWSYEWYKNLPGQPQTQILSATSSSYQIAANDIGCEISCRAIFSEYNSYLTLNINGVVLPKLIQPNLAGLAINPQISSFSPWFTSIPFTCQDAANHLIASSITWQESDNNGLNWENVDGTYNDNAKVFKTERKYRATVILVPATGYKVTAPTANYYNYSGAASCSYTANDNKVIIEWNGLATIGLIGTANIKDGNGNSIVTATVGNTITVDIINHNIWNGSWNGGSSLPPQPDITYTWLGGTSSPNSKNYVVAATDIGNSIRCQVTVEGYIGSIISGIVNIL